MSMSNLSDVFISYSRKDTKFVRRLVDAFKTEGMEVWVDWEDIPTSVNWMEEIENGIDGADVFLFVISPDSLASDICMQELNIAVTRNKRFIPVLYREVEEVTGPAHAVISSHNWAFFRERDDFAGAFANLVNTIKSDFGHMRQHTRLLVRANEWENNAWRNDFLLTGVELAAAQDWLKDALALQKDPSPTDLHKLYIQRSRTTAIGRRNRNIAVVSAALILAILSIGLFIARNAAVIARNDADEQRVFAQQQEATAIVLADENEALAESLALALHADTIAGDGDSFSALPFAIAAYNRDDTSYAGVSLSNIALSPGPLAWMLEHTRSITYIDTHPSRLIAATASLDTSIILWDLTVQPPAVIHRLDDHTERVRTIAFSPDGRFLASGGDDGGILLWDAETGELERVFSPVVDADAPNADQVTFSPDGRYLLVSYEDLREFGTADDLHELRVYDVFSGDVVQIVGGEGYSAGSIAFAPDGAQFIAGYSTGELWIYDFTPDADLYNDLTGSILNGEDTEFEFAEPVDILTGHVFNTLITHLDFNDDGTLLLSGAQDFDIHIWDRDSRTIIQTLDAHTDFIAAAEFIPGSNQVLSTSRDRNVIIYDLETGEPVTLMRGHDALPEALAVTYDGSLGITGSLITGVGIVWDLEVIDFATEVDSLTDEVRRVAYHPQNSQLAAAVSNDLLPRDDRPTLYLWNPLTGEVVQEFSDHRASAVDVAWAQDAQTLVTATGSVLTTWDVATGEAINESIEGNGTSIFDIAVNPSNSNEVVGATQGGDLILWNLADDSEPRLIEDLNATETFAVRLLAVNYNPDNPDQVFVSSNTRLFLYDLVDETIVYEFEGHRESVVGMAVNDDANLLVTTDISRDVFVWNYETRELLTILTFHTGTVWGAAIDPTGRYVATAADNGEVLLWDIEINALIRRFSGYDGRIRSVAFSPDGQYLLFGERELHQIRLFSADELLQWIDDNRIMDSVICAEQTGLIINPECDPAVNQPEEIFIASQIVGSVHLDAPDAWLYAGTAGEIISLAVQATSPVPVDYTYAERQRAAGYLDPMVTIYDVEGNVLATNDNASETTRNAAIPAIELPVDGTYRIEVAAVNQDTFGQFVLEIARGDADDLLDEE